MAAISAYYDFLGNTCSFDGGSASIADDGILLMIDRAVVPSEEIVSCYKQYGTDCARHLPGSSAFVLFDHKDSRLLVVRDKLGERPMYYAQLPTGIQFASELGTILPKITYPTIRPHELAQPIRHNYPIELQHTWIEQIMRLRAGEYAVVDKDGLRLYTYFKRDHTPTYKGTKAEAIQESLRLMRQSVKRCMETSAGPVAVMLSGGIDSSSLAEFSKELQQEVHVFSAGYIGNRYTACDERPIARRFAEENGLVFHDVELDVNDFQCYLDELLPFLDEPAFDVNCMVQFAVYKKAAEMGFKTILSGLGGDEQFYGYRDMQRLARAIKTNKGFVELYPAGQNKRKLIAFVLRNLKSRLLPTQAVILSERNPSMWTYDDYQKFAVNGELSMHGETIKFSDIDVTQHFSDDTDVNSLYDYMFSTFANTLCVYMGNKLSAACGIDIRYPLLDIDLVSFLDSLPLEMKFNSERPKQFQKEILEGLLPDHVLNGKKRGFEPPFEFIWDMCAKYEYKHFKADHVFFNSMVADKMIDNMLYK